MLGYYQNEISKMCYKVQSQGDYLLNGKLWPNVDCFGFVNQVLEWLDLPKLLNFEQIWENSIHIVAGWNAVPTLGLGIFVVSSIELPQVEADFTHIGFTFMGYVCHITPSVNDGRVTIEPMSDLLKRYGGLFFTHRLEMPHSTWFQIGW